MHLKIIFIDDEENLCHVYKHLFASHDLEIVTFTDSQQAIDYINSQNKIDLCFIDYRMPYKDGFQIRDEISEDIPCYLITGELNIVLPDNFVDKLAKPLKEDLFQSILKQHRNP